MKSATARKAVLFGTLFALSLGSFLSCSDSDSPSAPASAMLRVELTDAPTDELSAVNVYIAGLTVKPSTGEVERLAGDIGEVELLALQGTKELLVAADVEPGDYEFIMVELDQSKSSVVEAATNEKLPLKIASEEIKVLGGFTVERGGTTTVLLDFDVERSLVKRGNGDWLLTPIIVITSSSQS